MSDLSHPPDLSEAPGFQADPYAPDYGFDQGQAGPGYRVPPGNEPAEQALLGAILTNNDLLDKAAETLAAEHFFVPANGRVFAACVAFRERGRAATPITLKEYFETDGDLRDIGGFAYLAELAANTDIVPDIAAYAKTIYDAYLRRQLITLGTDIVNDSYRHEVDTTAQDLLEDAESRLYVMAESHVAEGGFKPFGAVLNAAIAVAEQALKRDTPLTGVTTGLIELDKMLGGLQRSDLLILAGRPGMGKTALATTIAFNAAKAYADKQGKEGAVTAFFSLEMSAEQLATRVLSTVARISSDAIRKGDLRQRDFPALVEASQEIHTVPLFIDDTAGLTISQLRVRARRLKRQQKLGLVVVDYLQLMRGTQSQRNENRVQEISEITRGLKLIAKELDVPVIALSQLSRQVEQRDDKRPQLADLRESGSIEQDADVVMFVYREAYYLAKKEPMEGTTDYADWQAEMDKVHNVADVIIAKQRHGPTGIRQLHFEGAYTRFSNLGHDRTLDR